ncbi:mannitol dehydrogenase family protein [Mesorhizobium sp. M7A.F.Ca.US.006.04.2.1]|uniref:mannitol dehydrogenase family protein n=1 Tax=unclassified Mesorhizobium TaxID=325217 RepID=UPI000FCA8A71|nr:MULTISPECIES: mannitol dehydrogenase family protein [unclassified Mesorhizobium]RUX75425.1 mannitol dehydrogenase family protein [Mesorhizobium sp. M7A.F.Ca.US.005.03.1.1]RUY14873.1 mannitol dehydrogenase family protein [Mesorhizobium sp. M7A.F.Ca.US.005.03.2.1]RUY26514.1 mannitol dehydrogenase family protein [Mesorhizobium sp. M7A.F.Ca.US.001.04.2.1]RUY44858.1 mannitol dehydrogenase family protein [Mesorhizobium sp. M7A.F.Ca.US.001.04.1.1]RVA07893.1 mannitol dehydrogenase family protein [M
MSSDQTSRTTTTERLSTKTVRALPASIATPSYDRSRIVPGIVHLGVGAFHRAHQAAYVDDCLAAGETDWSITGVSLRSADTRDALTPQDGLYTLAIRSSGTEKLQVIGSITAMLVAPEDPSAVLAALTDPRTRIVTLTITEKAYLRAAGGGLDAAHPDIAHDLANPQMPKTAHGFLTEALARRRAAGTPPFTVLCCDNLPANGATLHRLLTEFAELRDAKHGVKSDVRIADHIAHQVAFPSSMVDRIVPATTDADRARIAEELGAEDAWPVMTEPFCQWVVEDNFPAGRPDWEQFGVTMVRDVGPFEDMKLRLLNGSHSAIAYLGLLSGHATVDRAFADPAIRQFVDALWAEAIPTLPEDAGLDTSAYTAELAERFANTALAHRTAQIANDGSQKLPQRIVASAIECLEAGTELVHLTLVVAAWIAACAARGKTLPEGHFTDPLDAALTALLGEQLPANETVTAVFDLAGFARDHAERQTLIELVAVHLVHLRRDGPTLAFAALGI